MNRKVNPKQTNSAAPERSYSISEISKALGVSRHTVQSAIDQGLLKAFRLPVRRNMVRISERAFQEYLRAAEADQRRPYPLSARQIADEVQ